MDTAVAIIGGTSRGTPLLWGKSSSSNGNSEAMHLHAQALKYLALSCQLVFVQLHDDSTTMTVHSSGYVLMRHKCY